MSLDPNTISLAQLIAEDLYNMVAVASYDTPTDDWLFYYANRAFTSVYGGAADRVSGGLLDSLGVLVAGDANSWEGVRNSLRRNEAVHVVIALPSAVSDPRLVDLALSPVGTPAGKRLIAVGCPRDVLPDLPAEVVIPESRSTTEGSITKDDIVRPHDGSEMGVICSACARLRTSSGEFVPVEDFFTGKLGVPMSQGLCEPCYQDVLSSTDSHEQS